jgi:thiol-disulfide isomerase/thioredoxin
MTGLRAASRALAWTLAVLVLGGCLGGCVTVQGRGRPGAGARHPGDPSDESLGLARPFLSLAPVALDPVPDSYDPAADASDAVAQALAAARRDGRPVLLDFGSAWCEDCRAMSALVDTPGVHQVLARNYHTVTIDVGHFDHNLVLAQRYVDLAASGIPALVELAPDGSLLHGDEAGLFSDARTLGEDQLADTLIDWLYRGPGPAGSSPAGPSPAGPSPAGPSPAGASPAGSSPAGPDPAGPSPAGSGPAAPGPAGRN